ncbi:MAG: hypothetical protein WC637_00530 [Victivallales bacterium]|jgi:hypothetical protein
MSQYKLKKNVADFVVVDGVFAGRNYKAGQLYDQIPPQEAKKFETVVTEETAPQKTAKNKDLGGGEK